MKYKLAIFDFDGTLADSLPFFLSSVNTLAEKHRFKKVDDADIERLRRYDAKRILNYLGVPFWKVPFVARTYTAMMGEHAAEIPMFPGVAEMLHTLSEKGVVLGLVTSNTYENVRTILGGDIMSLMVHPHCGTGLYGKAAKLRSILRKTGIDAGDAVYIGDEIRDASAAHEVKMSFGAVTWGYTDTDMLLESSPEMLFRRVGEITEKLA